MHQEGLDVGYPHSWLPSKLRTRCRREDIIQSSGPRNLSVARATGHIARAKVSLVAGMREGELDTTEGEDEEMQKVRENRLHKLVVDILVNCLLYFILQTYRRLR